MPNLFPTKFKTPADLKKAIDKWLNMCAKKKKPLTITGLALALDTTRNILIDYEERDEYGDYIKTAKMMCHNYAEEFLFSGRQVAGAIFNLKNNYGWVDKTEIKHSGTINDLKEINNNDLQRQRKEAEEAVAELEN